LPLTTFGQEIAAQGWRTGAVVAHADVSALAQYLVRPGTDQQTVMEMNDWLVVVSQTCDVRSSKLDAEPFVEVLHCRSREKLRTQHKELRSTRVLDFKPNRQTHEAVVLSAHAIADRYHLPREVLKDRTPDDARRLSEDSTSRILAWYALRYGRPIWPNQFVSRIGKTKAALVEALESLKDDIAQVRVGIAEKNKELVEGDAYHVVVYFVVDEERWESDVNARSAIYAAFAKFVSELTGCDGIEVNEDLSSVVSGGEFTWQETKVTDEWNFVNLSHHVD